MYILELKKHRNDSLQNVNHNHFNIHQHVTNVIFEEQGETTNVDTHHSASLLMNQKGKEQSNALGYQASTQLDVE